MSNEQFQEALNVLTSIMDGQKRPRAIRMAATVHWPAIKEALQDKVNSVVRG